MNSRLTVQNFEKVNFILHQNIQKETEVFSQERISDKLTDTFFMQNDIN
jgi:hypothetical protein